MIIYLGFVLITLETDAIMAVALKKKYNFLSSLFLSMVWPISALCVIYYAATKQQKAEETE